MKKIYLRKKFIKLIFVFLLVFLFSPLIIYLLSNIKVKGCIYLDRNNEDDYLIIQTFKWDFGRYYAIDTKVPNFEKYKLGKCKIINGEHKVVYIRNILGNNFDKQLSDNITIEEQMSPNNDYTVNAFAISGYLIPTKDRFDNSPVCDLYVENWNITKEIQRNGVYELICPNYYLTVVDFRLFSNLFCDIIIIYIISLLLFELLYIGLRRMFGNKLIRFLVTGVSSLILSIAFFTTIVYLFINL